jgi:hypothetical protein
MSRTTSTRWKVVNGMPVPKNAAKPADKQSIGGLSDKIMEAHDLAAENWRIQNVRFKSSIGTKQIPSAVRLVGADSPDKNSLIMTCDDPKRAAQLAKDLNKAIGPVVEAFVKENETSIRGILGRRSD